MRKQVRETSVEAYIKIKNSGLVSRMRLLVYKYLLENGPLTGGELDDLMTKGEGKRGNYHKRLSELRDMNLAREEGTKVDKRTKKRSIVWQATYGPPKPMPKRVTKLEMYRKLAVRIADSLEKHHPRKAKVIRKKIDQIETRFE